MKLFPYQVEGVKFCANKVVSLLADEPGLGKTIQTIGVINVCNYNKIVIICPASLIYNWQNELNKWLKESLNLQIIKNGHTKIKEDTQIVIGSYHLICNDFIQNQISSKTWDLVIIDEAHYLKNPKALRTKKILGKETFLKKASKIMLLTGTPILNRPIEIYPILRTLFPKVLGKYNRYQAFTERYCGAHQTIMGWDVSGSSNEEELGENLKKVMIRRYKKDVIKDLPDKIYQVIDLDPGQAEIKNIVNREKLMYEDLKNSGLNLYAELATVRRELGEAKVPHVVNHILMLLESGIDKLVVFAHHKNVVDALSAAFSKNNIINVVVKGDTSITQRQEHVTEFQNNPNVKIFVGNITSAGVGITLTAAYQVVFAEFSWSPAEIQQAIDRCHRIGQKNCVIAQFLTIQNSLDSYMIKTIIDKEFIINKIIN
jgi:SWI/SNF-related matrix-associated actin-dependent regulator of chromatin subfamily A-like protein 1